MMLWLDSKPTRMIGSKIIKRMIKKHAGIDVNVDLKALEIKVVDGKTYCHLDVDLESNDCISTIIKKLDR